MPQLIRSDKTIAHWILPYNSHNNWPSVALTAIGANSIGRATDFLSFQSA